MNTINSENEPKLDAALTNGDPNCHKNRPEQADALE